MAMTIPRTNHQLAAIVDQGIALAEQFGHEVGGVFMRRHQVPLEVAVRVLSRPDQRRNYA